MHIKKRFEFHGVEYIVVPCELWYQGIGCAFACSENFDTPKHNEYGQLHDAMIAYDETGVLTDE